MKYKRLLPSILFIFLNNTPSVAQINVPDTPHCENSLHFFKNNCYECDNYLGGKNCKVDKFDFLFDFWGINRFINYVCSKCNT